MYQLFNFSGLKWSVNRLNTTHKLVIVWNVTWTWSWPELQRFPFSFFRLGYAVHGVMLNSDWANLTFAAPSLKFIGHEAGIE